MCIFKRHQHWNRIDRLEQTHRYEPPASQQRSVANWGSRGPEPGQGNSKNIRPPKTLRIMSHPNRESDRDSDCVAARESMPRRSTVDHLLPPPPGEPTSPEALPQRGKRLQDDQDNTQRGFSTYLPTYLPRELPPSDHRSASLTSLPPFLHQTTTYQSPSFISTNHLPVILPQPMQDYHVSLSPPTTRGPLKV